MSAVSARYPATSYAASTRSEYRPTFGYAELSPTMSPAVPAVAAGLGTGILMTVAGVFRKMPLALAGAGVAAGASLAVYNMASQKQAEQRKLDYLA